MTGIEKIVKHIEDNAASAANAVITEAKSKADEIIAVAKAEGEKKSKEILQQSVLNVQACLSRAESAALLKEKRLILDAKQDMIGNIIASAKDAIAKLPDKDYFDVIIKMIKKYALDLQGQILFSPADRKRLPEQFDAAIRMALSGKQGAALSISEQTRDIDGGFVLIYGDVEENCSFDALFFAKKEYLQDKVSALLFD